MDRVAVKRSQVYKALDDVERLNRQGGLLVGQIMTVVPSCIAPETSVLELIKLFRTKRFRHLLVTNSAEELVGVLSDRDVIRCLGPEERPDRERLGQITAADIMSTDLVTISPSTPVERALVLMIDEGISCLPVQAGGSLVGIVTNTDLHVSLQLLLETLRQAPVEESVAGPGCN